MPSSARKSSIGAVRRGPQKAHIPYRGGNTNVGKRTGIAVQHVERKSDGFEPFEELIQQADKMTPPKPKGRKRKSMIVPEEEFDEYGEMSMELDDSPMQYFANSRQPITPTSSGSGPSIRPVTRTSDIDFDQIPSPRSGSAHKSLGHRMSGPGPSRLSTSFRPQEDDDELDSDGQNQHDRLEPASGSAHGSHHGTSFRAMDQDDDDDDDDDEGGHDMPHEEPMEENSPPLSSSRRDKGKGRALSDVAEETGSEDEIAKGLEDVQEHDYSDEVGGLEEHQAEPSPRRTKKTKFAEEPQKPVRRTNRSKKENRVFREGVRKSAREHYKPLEWWRGEKLVYGRSQRRENGVVLVPPIREIVRIPKEEAEPLGKRKRSRARSKSKAPENERIKIVPVANPEEGWDKDTEPHCVLLDFKSNLEVERRVAYTWNMLELKKVPTDNWFFQKVFGDDGFFAAGVLIIPPHSRKPTKQTKDNTYMFYVIEGAINLKLHETSLVLATGAMFIVPRGNVYFIENISERDVKLFFAQARKVEKSDEEKESHLAPPRRSSAARPSSAAPGSARDKATPAPMRAASTRS